MIARNKKSFLSVRNWLRRTETEAQGRRAENYHLSRVEVLLRGGLGNQLFGYAAGTELATRLGVPLHLIVQPNMGTLGAERTFVLESVLPSDVTWSDIGVVAKRFQEASFAFDPEFAELMEPCLLDGYFQSWRYFENSEERIRKQISSTPEFVHGGKLVGQEFLAVHVRRGDYLIPRNAKIHGLVPFEFFIVGLDYLRKIHGNLPAILFSDDVSEAKRLSLELDRCDVFDEDHKKGPLETLGAFSAAQGHVISNSSFSWWGAFLRGNDNIVIAPRPWFVDPSIDTTDLLRPRWISMGFARPSVP